jgi:hypothetical protein
MHRSARSEPVFPQLSAVFRSDCPAADLEISIALGSEYFGRFFQCFSGGGIGLKLFTAASRPSSGSGWPEGLICFNIGVTPLQVGA